MWYWSRMLKKSVPQGPASEVPKHTLRYVEPLSEAKTMHGKRRVSARQELGGWEIDFFSTLLIFRCSASSPSGM